MVTGLFLSRPCPHTLPGARQRAPRHERLLASLMLLMLLITPQVRAQSEPARVFIELASSEDRVYVQQQLILTVRLHFNANLIRGELSTPEHPDAVIEQLGRQREFNRTLDDQSYRVVERRYAVFPQSPGTLSLPPVRFEGLARHPRGHAYRISEEASLFDIEVRDVPAGFQGRQWLPARSLSLRERGLPETGEITAGTSLSRHIDVTVEGLQGTALPPLPDHYPDNLKAYPEPASRQSVPGPEGINGSLEQTFALVPIEGDSVTLPEIRVHWWDVTADEPRVAVLPARRYQVTGTKPAIVNEPAETAKVEERSTGTAGLWPWLALLLVLGWAVTLWQLVKARRELQLASKGPLQAQPAERSLLSTTSESELFDTMIRQLRNSDGSWTLTFCHWLSGFAGQPLRTLEDALRYLSDGALENSLRAFQAECWRPDQAADNANAERLIRLLQGIRAQLRASGRQDKTPPHSLPSF